MFILDAQQLDRTLKIGRTLPVSLHMQLAELLVQYKDIFAWSSAYLGIVPNSIAENKLGIPLN